MLEERLGSIQVVTGMLKVLRSYPLLSLSFLKSLRRIDGIKPNKSRDVVDSFQYALLAVQHTSMSTLCFSFFNILYNTLYKYNTYTYVQYLYIRVNVRVLFLCGLVILLMFNH